MKNIFKTWPLLMLVLLFSACEKDGAQNLPNRDYSLVWSDEFDGEFGAGPDSTSWNYDIGTGQDGWGNQELQYYTNSPNNVALDGDGNLAIVARNEPLGSAPFTSGRITTKNLVSVKYGRIEARMKLPFGPGIWPAFWMLGDNIDEVSWPQCGEIDIMELKGQQPSVTYGSVHGPGYSGGFAITERYNLGNERFDADFHVFAIEWGKDYIDYFIDDFLFHRVRPEDVPGEWVYNESFYMILNIAVGGTFVGFPTTGTPFPQTLLVDYVRVYEQQ
jgi:beta-glucanase (GH16 family)